MPDPRFFPVAGPFTLADLAEIGGAALSDAADRTRRMVGVAPVEDAGPDQVSFLDNTKYVAAFEASRAGACVVRPAQAGRAPDGMALLLSDDPYRAYARIAWAFHPAPRPEPGIAPSAHIDPTARLGADCRVDPGAVIGARVEIGPGCHVGAHAVIGDAVEIGAESRIGAQCTLQCCVIGERVILHPGARIGQDGFGFALGASGHLKVPQLGRVIVGDDVEVGANATIDRGAGPDTVIGAGTKIDNLVQIGHNVRLGRGCVVVAQAGLSGSTRVGDMAMFGGQSGMAGHLTIGDGARVAAKSGVFRDIPAGQTVTGIPALPVKEFWRQVAALSKLAKRKGDR